MLIVVKSLRLARLHQIKPHTDEAVTKLKTEHAYWARLREPNML